MIRRCAVPALTIALASCLVACSSSGGDKASPSPSPSSKPTSSKTTSAPVPIVQPTSKLPSIANNVTVRKWNTVKSCGATAAGWQAKGVMANHTDSDATYQIQIYFTTDPGGTVQATGSTKVAVAAGKSSPWTVAATFKALKNTQCVPVGVAPVR